MWYMIVYYFQWFKMIRPFCNDVFSFNITVDEANEYQPNILQDIRKLNN